VRHKLLEMNLLLWCQGPNIPWSDDELSVIYTSERSERWARELNSFIGQPPDVQSESWPISDLDSLVRHLDPDTETALQSGDCVVHQLHQELEHQLLHQELQQQLSHQEELVRQVLHQELERQLLDQELHQLLQKPTGAVVGLEAATDDGDNRVARRRTPTSGRVRMRTDRGRALGANGGDAEMDGCG
jgi:hypothetical protein